MNCPHCTSAITKEETQKTSLGYYVFRCSACKHRFNERTGTPFNFLEYPTDVVLLEHRSRNEEMDWAELHSGNQHYRRPEELFTLSHLVMQFVGQPAQKNIPCSQYVE